MVSDLSLGMVRESRRRLAGSSVWLQSAAIDARSICFPDHVFDAVIANHMLYHIPERPRSLSEIRRVLRAGGRLYASTVGHDHLRELSDMVQRFGGRPTGPSDQGSFTLENGGEQLRDWFSTVRLHRYEDSLVITEAEPLIAYILSMGDHGGLADDKLHGLAEYVQRELSRHGAIHITKDSGMFEAT